MEGGPYYRNFQRKILNFQRSSGTAGQVQSWTRFSFVYTTDTKELIFDTQVSDQGVPQKGYCGHETPPQHQHKSYDLLKEEMITLNGSLARGVVAYKFSMQRAPFEENLKMFINSIIMHELVVSTKN